MTAASAARGRTRPGGPYLLAVDAGTGSCRALLFTEAGEQVAVSLREWSHREPPGVPGGQDFDVEANWGAITACIRGVLQLAGASGDEVAAVAATSMREGIVLYDAHGTEIWACPNVDSRAAREAGELISEGAAERIFAESGDWVSITSPARLRWLARHRPDLLRRVHSLGMLSDWIVWRLARVQVTEPSCGSSSGMFSLARRDWSAQIAGICGLSPAVLPDVADPGTVVGAVTPEAAAQTGLRPGTPVAAGGADTQLGLLGAGVRAGEFTVLAGTFWQNVILVGQPLIDPQARLRTLCHVTPGEWMLEGIGFYCGMAMRWYRDAFCDAEVAAARQRGVDPYVVLPKMVGKVNPARKTPVNAIGLQVGVQVLAFACVLIWGVTNVFFSWANAITIGLVFMYLLCNIGVVRYYLTEGRAQFNLLLHMVVPVVASAAGILVVWKSYFSPFTSTGPVFWGLMTFVVVLVLTVVILICLRATRHEDWMHRAQLVFEQTGGH